MNDIPANARHRLLLVRDLDRAGDDGQNLRRMRDQGELVRIRRGCYLPSSEWNALTPEGRHLARAHAVAANASIEPVFSHFTAAVLHGIPIFGNWPVAVHVTIGQGATRRRQVELVSHSLPLEADETARIDGLLVTSLTRTVIDLAVTTSFQSAVASLDWSLNGRLSRQDLHVALERSGPVKRRRAAEQAIDFADRRSGSVGESISRAGMFLLGFQIPALQVPFGDRSGTIGVTDFFWSDAGLIGEFDGKAKYLRDEFTASRSTSEVVIAEKRREDRLRAIGMGVCRWDWEIASDLTRLGAHLRDAGVPTLH